MSNPGNLSVLLVEDDEASAFLTTCQLEESPLFGPLAVFNNAQSALSYIEQHFVSTQACASLPQVLITDAYMPVLDGFELLERLYNLCPDLRRATTVCMLTVSDSPRDQRKAQQMGIDCYFEKPLNDRHFQLIKAAAIRKGASVAGAMP